MKSPVTFKTTWFIRSFGDEEKSSANEALSDAKFEYEHVLLTYLDILGFKRQIEDSTKNPQKISEILRILRMMKKFGQSDQVKYATGCPPQKLVSCQSFSDLTVRRRNNKPDPDGGLLMLEIHSLALIQTILLVEHKILIRGGISIGDLFSDEEFLFGPALVRSYELAEQAAIYPRVVIDSKVMQQYEGQVFNRYIREALQRSEDGTYYIDYLHTILTNPAILALNASDKRQLLMDHKKVTEDKLSETVQSERSHQKALWLALYHNSVVRRFSTELTRHGETADVYFISARGI